MFWTRQGLELTMAMVACLRPAQDQASQNSSVGGAEAHEAPPLADE